MSGYGFGGLLPNWKFYVSQRLGGHIWGIDSMRTGFVLIIGHASGRGMWESRNSKEELLHCVCWILAPCTPLRARSEDRNALEKDATGQEEDIVKKGKGMGRV